MKKNSALEYAVDQVIVMCGFAFLMVLAVLIGIGRIIEKFKRGFKIRR